MELYLRWLDRHERQPGENPPLGLILAADRNEELIELLDSIEHARERLTQKQNGL